MSAPQNAALAVLERRLDPRAPAPIVTTFSGGGDSLALMLAARVFAEQAGRRLIALHVDHGLQPQSAAWADQAQAAAARLGIPMIRLAWTGPKPSSGLPAAAREARHGLIAEACRTLGASVALIGHTLDDQLENALMRGAGVPVGPLREWAPSPMWPEGRGLFLCRPLLAIRRADLRAWLTAEGLSWLDDPANADLRYARARARQALAEGAGCAPVAELDLGALAGLWRVTPWGGVAIDRPGLLHAAPDRGLRLLQIAAACASGAPGLARPGRARGVMARLTGDKAFVVSLCGARIAADGDMVTFEREAGEIGRGGLKPIAVQAGQTGVWDGRFEIAAGGSDVGVEALRGHAARLDARDRTAMLGVSVVARPALPVFRRLDHQPAAPRLALPGADAHIDFDSPSCRALCEDRLAAAAGMVTWEAEIGQAEIRTIARMAKSLRPPYVKAGSKD
jgi:tRNA(Ile)-lysidine synthase